MNDKVKNVLKYVSRYLIILIIALCAFLAVTLIPTRYIEKSVISSVNSQLESRYKVQILNKCVVFDTYTDALMLSTAYSLDNKNPFESMLACRSNYISGYTTDVSLDVFEGENVLNERFDILSFENLLRGHLVKSYEYARYWQGYLTILKPLMITFDYHSIILINYIVNYLLIFYFIYLMHKKGIKKSYIFAIIISFIAIDGLVIFSCLEESITVTIMLISTVYLLEKNTKNIYKYMMTVGILTSFFEWLTTPIFTYILPVLIYIILRKKENASLKEIVKIVIKTGIFWCIGYLTMWASKWIIVDMFYNKGLIRTALREAMYRTDVLYYSPITVILSNFGFLGFIVAFYFIAILLINGVYTIYYKIRYKKLDERLKYNLLFTLLSFIPVVWQIIFTTHSFTHAYFVYRDYYITILFAQMILLNLLSKFKNKKIVYSIYTIITIVIIILNYIII